MAYDEELAHRIRAHLQDIRFTEQAMFGGLAFLIGGRMSVAVSGGGGLLVRVVPAETRALLAEPGAMEFDMGRGPVQGWLRIDPTALDDDTALAAWVRRGVAYAGSLPPKR